ncbi:MAG: hypothetical protein U1E62_23825 [Alsobacter sp.]
MTCLAAAPRLLLVALLIGPGGEAAAEFAARRTPPPSDTDADAPDQPFIVLDASTALYLSDRLGAFAPDACRAMLRVQRLQDGSFRVHCDGQGPYRVPPAGSTAPTVNCARLRSFSLGLC